MVTPELYEVEGLVGSQRLLFHEGCVNRLWWTEDGQRLLSVSDDRRVAIWDWGGAGEEWRTGHEGERVLEGSPSVVSWLDTGHSGNVFGVRALPWSGERALVTCAMDGGVRLHRLREDGRWASASVVRHEDSAMAVETSATEPHLVWTAGEDGVLLQIDFRERPRSPAAARAAAGRGGGRLRGDGRTAVRPEWSGVPGVSLRARPRPAGEAAGEELGRGEVWDPRWTALVHMRTGVTFRHVKICPSRPHYLALACSDPVLRVVDRRMPPRAWRVRHAAWAASRLPQELRRSAEDDDGLLCFGALDHFAHALQGRSAASGAAPLQTTLRLSAHDAMVDLGTTSVDFSPDASLLLGNYSHCSVRLFHFLHSPQQPPLALPEPLARAVGWDASGLTDVGLGRGGEGVDLDAPWTVRDASPTALDCDRAGSGPPSSRPRTSGVYEASLLRDVHNCGVTSLRADVRLPRPHDAPAGSKRERASPPDSAQDSKRARAAVPASDDAAAAAAAAQGPASSGRAADGAAAGGAGHGGPGVPEWEAKLCTWMVRSAHDGEFFRSPRFLGGCVSPGAIKLMQEADANHRRPQRAVLAKAALARALEDGPSDDTDKARCMWLYGTAVIRLVTADLVYVMDETDARRLWLEVLEWSCSPDAAAVDLWASGRGGPLPPLSVGECGETLPRVRIGGSSDESGPWIGITAERIRLAVLCNMAYSLASCQTHSISAAMRTFHGLRRLIFARWHPPIGSGSGGADHLKSILGEAPPTSSGRLNPVHTVDVLLLRATHYTALRTASASASTRATAHFPNVQPILVEEDSGPGPLFGAVAQSWLTLDVHFGQHDDDDEDDDEDEDEDDEEEDEDVAQDEEEDEEDEEEDEDERGVSEEEEEEEDASEGEEGAALPFLLALRANLGEMVVVHGPTGEHVFRRRWLDELGQMGMRGAVARIRESEEELGRAAEEASDEQEEEDRDGAAAAASAGVSSAAAAAAAAASEAEGPRTWRSTRIAQVMVGARNMETGIKEATFWGGAQGHVFRGVDRWLPVRRRAFARRALRPLANSWQRAQGWRGVEPRSRVEELYEDDGEEEADFPRTEWFPRAAQERADAQVEEIMEHVARRLPKVELARDIAMTGARGRRGYVVAGSDQGYVWVFDVESGVPIAALPGEIGGVVNAVQPNPVRPLLASSGLDHDIQIWKPGPRADVRAAARLERAYDWARGPARPARPPLVPFALVPPTTYRRSTDAYDSWIVDVPVWHQIPRDFVRLPRGLRHGMAATAPLSNFPF